MSKSDPWKGLIAATYTPMHQDGSLNLEMVPRVVDHLVQHGIAGIYAVGSTGEGVSMTSQERQDAAAAFVRAAAGRLPVIVQVGHTSVAAARQLAAHARQIGAAAISAIPPFYFKPANVEALVTTMAEIASAAGDLPFFYYHIPQMTGCGFDMVEFLRLGSQRIPTLVGIKYTATTLYEMQACIEYENGRFRVFHGTDEMLLSGLAAGACGAVGSTYNYAPEVGRHVLTAFQQGNIVKARRWQARSVEMVRVILRYGSMAGQKAVMKMIGLDCGPPRLPILPLSDRDFAALQRELEAIGFFRWALDPKD